MTLYVNFSISRPFIPKLLTRLLRVPKTEPDVLASPSHSTIFFVIDTTKESGALNSIQSAEFLIDSCN